MLTFRQVSEYRQTLKKRAKKMSNLKTPYQAGLYHILQDIDLAPVNRYQTPETIHSLTLRKQGRNKAKVESFVPGPFKQNLWSNLTPPFLAPRMVWNKNKPTIYGTGPAQYTGSPGWFDIATYKTSKKYVNMTMIEVHNILNSK